MTRHFLTGNELTAAELDGLLERAAQLKADPLSSRALAGRSVALVFERPSTRTRVSFEVGVHELGGLPVVLRPEELQISRGESPRDTALVLSRHVAAVGIRTGPQALLEELAQYASVPVFNMLTTEHHPCQPLADLLTVREAFGAQTLTGGGAPTQDGTSSSRLKLAYVGDGNNMARSLAVLGTLAGLDVAVASPAGYSLARETIPLSAEARGSVSLHEDPREAAAGAHVLYTDVWVSMGDEDTANERRALLAPYRIDDELVAVADPTAIVLHCLPAHPGEEIAEDILYGERQRIWDQAENRRHAQKALLELLLGDA